MKGLLRNTPGNAEGKSKKGSTAFKFSDACAPMHRIRGTYGEKQVLIWKKGGNTTLTGKMEPVIGLGYWKFVKKNPDTTKQVEGMALYVKKYYTCCQP